MKLPFLLSLAFILLNYGAVAQALPDEATELQQLFPTHNAAILEYKEAVTITEIDGELSAHTNVFKKTIALQDLGIGHLNDAVSFSLFNDASIKKAYAYLPKSNGKYKKHELTDFPIKKYESDNILFDDHKYYEVNFKGLQTGAISELHYEQKIADLHFLNSFRFSHLIPAEKLELSITFPSHVVLKWTLFNEENLTNPVSFTEKTNNGLTTYTWHTTNNLPLKGLTRDNYSHENPHLIYRVASYGKDEKKSFLNDVDDLYKWYYELAQKGDSEPTDAMKALVQELTKSAKNDRDKVTAIFGWVKENIRYIAFEDGWNGFIPRKGVDIFEKRYGDCKDMSNLTHELLKEADVDAHLVWIGTRSVPYDYTELPTPYVDNHMISAVNLDGSWVFLDGTDAHLPFGYPTEMIQGKQALISKSATEYELVRVPIIPADKNQYNATYDIQIEGDKVFGKSDISLTGYKKGNFEHYYGLAANKEKYLDRKFELGSDKVILENITVKNEFNQIKDSLLVTHDFTIPSYAKQVGSRLIFNPFFKRPYGNFVIDTVDQKFNVDLDHANEYNITMNVNIPTGYSLKKVPTTSSYQHHDFGFNISYKLSADQRMLHIYQNVKANILQIKTTDFNAWNTMVKQLKKTYKRSILLEKTN